MKSKKIMVLDFPPKSNDLNIIENVCWQKLKKKINKKLKNVTVSTKDQLIECSLELKRTI